MRLATGTTITGFADTPWSETDALRPWWLLAEESSEPRKFLLPEGFPASDLFGAGEAILLELSDRFPRPFGDEGDREARLARQDVEARRLVRLVGPRA